MPRRSSVTLLYTNSFDGTADLVVKELQQKNVFRLNFDLWADYTLYVDSRGFRIQNPAGQVVTESDIKKVYWRKPIPKREIFPESASSAEDTYMEEELWYAMRDIMNLLWGQGKVVLVEPFAEHRIGKLVQMRAAKKSFTVPDWKFVRGSKEDLIAGKESVVKSLTLKRVASKSVIYATKVQEQRLDPDAPWLIQDYVDAAADVTVAYVRGEVFAFELARTFTKRTIDWREVSLDPAAPRWSPHRLPPSLIIAIQEYMNRLSLDYGRLDLLRRRTGEYLFLEVNPHGEWGWLDPKGEFGLLKAIIREVSPRTPVHPIPVTPAFAMHA